MSALEDVRPVFSAVNEHLWSPVLVQCLLPLQGVDLHPREHFRLLDRDEEIRHTARHRLRLQHVVGEDVAWLERKYLAENFGRWGWILDLRQLCRSKLCEDRLAVPRANRDRNWSHAFLEYDALILAI